MLLRRFRLFGFGRTRASGIAKPAKAAAPVATSYRAVEVKPGKACCEAASCLAGKRHLLRDVPAKLPLPECTRMDACGCRFLHHEDRRAGPRRRYFDTIETKLGHELWSQQRPPEQVRRSRGRRKGD